MRPASYTVYSETRVLFLTVNVAADDFQKSQNTVQKNLNIDAKPVLTSY